MLPSTITFNDIPFALAPSGTASPDALIARGQKLDLPAGDYNTVYILAASADGDQTAAFTLGTTPIQLPIEAWNGYIGPMGHPPLETRNPRRQQTPRLGRLRQPRHMGHQGSQSLQHLDRQIPRRLPRPQTRLHQTRRHRLVRRPLPHPRTASTSLTPTATSSPTRLESPPVPPPLTLPKSDKIRVLAISATRQEPELTPSKPPLRHAQSLMNLE